MSLVFDLAELINLGVGAATGETVGSVKEWLVDRRTRQQVREAFSSVLEAETGVEPSVRRALVDLIGDADVVGSLVGGTADDPTPAGARWQELLGGESPAVVA